MQARGYNASMTSLLTATLTGEAVEKLWMR